MSAAFNKVNCFVQDVGDGLHNLNSNTYNLALTNVAPTATVTAYSGITDLTTANGYTAGGAAIGSTAYSQTSGLATMTGSNVTWTATGGSIGPAQYVFIYNFTASGKNAVGWWNYGSSFTLTVGESFTDNLSSGILTLQ